MANKQTKPKSKSKSNLERLARSRGKITVHQLVSVSDCQDILDTVSQLTGLRKIIVLTRSDQGSEVYHNLTPNGVVASLEIAKIEMANNILYPEDEEDE